MKKALEYCQAVALKAGLTLVTVVLFLALIGSLFSDFEKP